MNNRWALSSLALSMLLASLGTSIANVALPTLAQAFTASFQEVQWVILAYLLAVTVLIVTVGRLGDVSGHRRVLLAGIVLFMIASIPCGVAPTLGTLIAARALQGVGAAEWTKRPNAKDGLRAAAVELRLRGMSVPKIAVALGVARSTAFRWTAHIPLDFNEEAAERRKAHSKMMTDTRWAEHRARRDADREQLTSAAARSIGLLSKREVLLPGAAIYWCEGEKSKKWNPNTNRVRFINSDPCLIHLFLNFLEQLGYRRDELRYRLSIHESADVDEARKWWSDEVGLPVELLSQLDLKRHNPATVRHNTGEGYHGCLAVHVPRGRRLYWRIEGIMAGLAKAVDRRQGGDGKLAAHNRP